MTVIMASWAMMVGARVAAVWLEYTLYIAQHVVMMISSTVTERNQIDDIAYEAHSCCNHHYLWIEVKSLSIDDLMNSG